MLRRVRCPRFVPNHINSRAFPKTKLEKQYELMDEKQQSTKYKRYSRTPQGAPDSKIRKLRPPPDKAISHNLSYTLRHGASKQGLSIRTDGFAKVTDLLALHQYHSINFSILERIVKEDQKNRYTLRMEPGGSKMDDIWWIRANQGHSLPNVVIETTPITSPDQIPMAVHGTNKTAWERIAVEGLSRMGRHHVHFAQGLAGPKVISGMRSSSQICIFLNVPLVLRSGLELMLSSNGVVLCPGDERGIIHPRFFSRVEWAGNRQALRGWEGHRTHALMSHTDVEKDIVTGQEDAQPGNSSVREGTSPVQEGTSSVREGTSSVQEGTASVRVGTAREDTVTAP